MAADLATSWFGGAAVILNAIAAKLKRRAKDDFKGRHFEAALIVQAVSWYLRYPLSYRDIEEMLLERGARGGPQHGEPLGARLRARDRASPAGVPQAALRLRPHRRDLHSRSRPRRYLYRAIDKHGDPVVSVVLRPRRLRRCWVGRPTAGGRRYGCRDGRWRSWSRRR